MPAVWKSRWRPASPWPGSRPPPATCTPPASLAGAGLEDYSGLRTFIDRYGDQHFEALAAIERERRLLAEGVQDSEERSEIMEAPIDPDDLPTFAPPRRPLVEVLTSTYVDLLVLIVLNGLFFLAAYVGFLRFDLVD